MSREVRRVPLDFDWPLEQVWDGYLMPDRLRQDACPSCARGYTPAREWLDSIVGLLMMLPDETPEHINVSGKRRGRMHPYLERLEGRPNTQPSADIVDLTTGLAGRAPSNPWGHDTTDTYTAVRKIAEAAGLDPEAWGICVTCKGEAVLEAYEGQAAEAEAWEPTEPPTGDGWQLWETVTEGSPISPVLNSSDGLADWMSHPDRGARWVPKPAAAQFIADGWAPTAVFTPKTGLVSGVEWVGHHTEKEA